MRAVVIFESMFGNTGQIARAIAEELAGVMDVEVHDVTQAPAQPPDDVDLVVVGAPTHAFSLSRPATRADAVEKGGRHPEGSAGLREWLDELRDRPQGEVWAVFDTRADRVRRLPAGASRKASAMARRRHAHVIAVQSFYVSSTTGPLTPREADRARDWARVLARLAADRAGRPAQA